MFNIFLLINRSADSISGSIIKQASLDESVQMDTPPRSPPEPPADEELLGMVAPVPTQLKERPEMTARQRWHWAYNQIIMQLNVCKIKTYKYIFNFWMKMTETTKIIVKELLILCFKFRSLNRSRRDSLKRRSMIAGATFGKMRWCRQ